MANTTKDEFPSKPVPKVPESAKDKIEKEVKERYNKGENLYTIALEVFGFDNEEAVERVRRILDIMRPPQSRILED